MSKRQQEKLDYIDKHADIAMQSICKSFHKDIPNHLVTAGYRWGFDDGYKWYMNHPLGVLDEDYAWAVYNFINDWKLGKYGEIELQKAIKDNFKYLSMGYKEKFEDFLDKMQGLLDNAKKQGHIIVRVEDLESTFPELKEGEDERIRKSLIDMPKNDEKCYLKEIAWLERQGEQKLTDNVEPKFKVGDYVVGKYISGYITEVRDNCYLLDYQGFSIDKQDNYHLWTIQDAKDGDVLVDSLGNICIYQEPSTKLMYHSYCYGNHKCFIDMGGSHEIVGSSPATKEQREQLEKAMTDAGYTFDFEKKELKKIEQNPAWSEEDENIIDGLLSLCEEAQDNFPQLSTEFSNIEALKDWLKSLKTRSIWKPSDEQMDVLLSEVTAWTKGCPKQIILESLYNELKKLKG